MTHTAARSPAAALLCAAAFALCASACRHRDRSPHPAVPGSSTQTPGPAIQIEMGPPAAGTPLPATSLQALLPDTFGGAAAVGPATEHSLPLVNGGTLTLVRRTYKQGDVELQIELNDALHSDAPRKLVIGQQGVVRKNDVSFFAGEPIHGEPAIVQWHGPSRIALANVVVANRFVINVRVSPADSEAAARSAADALPFDALLALAKPAAPEPATKAEEPVVKEQAASKAGATKEPKNKKSGSKPKVSKQDTTQTAAGANKVEKATKPSPKSVAPPAKIP